MTTTSKYRWTSTTEPLPFTKSKFPSDSVIGEIKPHNPAGIAAGIVQLRGRRGITQRTPQLITYRQVPGQPTKYEILAADSTELAGVIRGRRAKLGTWYTLGIVESSAAAKPIPLWQCSTSLGNLLEPQIRQRYAARVGAKLKEKDNASLRGADIEHELLEMAEFFRELAAELEAEASP
jgi:hypothetical protein